MNNHSIKYRSDIDGLRAFAVLSVVIYHAYPNIISGGFVGVDVFFIISGYLISTIIFGDLEAGRFQYSDFYVRRVKRIFPALSLVLVTAMVVGWFILLPDEYEQLGKHVLSGVGFVSNIVLWREAGYFDTAAELKPLLHLWSLGVEEQYYIFWPILASIIWRHSHNFKLLIIPLLCISFILNLIFVSSRPTAVFFLPIFRFWELMLGSMLAYYVLHKKYSIQEKSCSICKNVVSTIGFGLLLLSFIVIDKKSIFPGWWALLPTIGAFFLIYSGPSAWINTNILSNRFVVYIGLISYPLYLWHWPILVYGRLVGIDDFPYGSQSLIVTSVLMAMMTYHWIEMPIRKNLIDSKKVAIRLSLIMVLIGVAGALLNTSIRPKNTSTEIEKITSAAGEWDYPGRLKKFNTSNFNFRQQGNVDRDAILIVGDSNIEQYYPRFEFLLERAPADFQMIFATSGGCPPILGVQEKMHPNCNGFMESVIDFTQSAKIRTVVIGAQWIGYFSGLGNYYYRENNLNHFLGRGSVGNELAFRSLQNNIENLIKKGIKVYLIGSIPIGQENDPKSMISRSIEGDKFLTIRSTALSKDKFLKTYSEISTELNRIAKTSGAIFIEPITYLCDSDICPTTSSDGAPKYKDSSHLRPSFVRKEIQFLDMIFDKDIIRSDDK